MPPTDPYAGTASLSSQSDRWAAVTPSDTVELTALPKALFIGVAGTVTVKGSDLVSAQFTCVAGQILDVRPRFVMATGTAASGIVALF